MKTRIEIFVDAEVPQDRIEEFRKSLEDAAWAMVGTWNKIAVVTFIQANEKALPIPSSGNREDYEAYRDSALRVTNQKNDAGM